MFMPKSDCRDDFLPLEILIFGWLIGAWFIQQFCAAVPNIQEHVLTLVRRRPAPQVEDSDDLEKPQTNFTGIAVAMSVPSDSL